MNSSTTITLDATHFKTAQPTGVELYTTVLLPAVTRELQLEGVNVAWVGHTSAPIELPEGVTWLKSPYQRFWSQTGLAKLLAQTEPNLFFTPSGIPPLRTAVKTVMTVHDLSVYEAPEAYSFGQRLRLQSISRYVAHNASQIIVPSHYTANQLIRFWKTPASKISIIPEGYTTTTAPEEAVPQLTDRPFFLFVGRIETKKNLGPLILGFQKLIEGGADIRLILAGSPGFGYEAIQKMIAKLPAAVEARVIEMGYVSEGQKRWLYANALAGVIPCPVEGFGLPILDCFQATIPAICAKSGAVPEVGADACLYAVPESPTDWYLQLNNVIQNTAEKSILVTRGSRYLQSYTWERAAKSTAAALLKTLI